MWDVEDPPGAPHAARIMPTVILRDARPGSIVLMHVMYPANRVAREALPLDRAGPDRREDIAHGDGGRAAEARRG